MLLLTAETKKNQFLITSDKIKETCQHTFMNCSMALEERELERNKVFGSARRAKQKRDWLDL